LVHWGSKVFVSRHELEGCFKCFLSMELKQDVGTFPCEYAIPVFKSKDLSRFQVKLDEVRRGNIFFVHQLVHTTAFDCFDPLRHLLPDTRQEPDRSRRTALIR